MIQFLQMFKNHGKMEGELPTLNDMLILCCYFPDSSELAYAGVIYMYVRMVDASDMVHVSLVLSKTKDAPLKRLTVPRLELCGANLLANLLHHIQGVLEIPSSNFFFV